MPENKEVGHAAATIKENLFKRLPSGIEGREPIVEAVASYLGMADHLNFGSRDKRAAGLFDGRFWEFKLRDHFRPIYDDILRTNKRYNAKYVNWKLEFKRNAAVFRLVSRFRGNDSCLSIILDSLRRADRRIKKAEISPSTQAATSLPAFSSASSFYRP